MLEALRSSKFDLTSTQEATVQNCYAAGVAAKLILELYFTSFFPLAAEGVVFGEWFSQNFIAKLGMLWKMDNDQFAGKLEWKIQF